MQNLMVVCHPDDEVLWGGGILQNGEAWTVLCCTNGANPARRERFKDAARLLGFTPVIKTYRDDYQIGFTTEELLLIKNDIVGLVNAHKVSRIVGHGPDGEYGHIQHRQIGTLLRDNDLAEIVEFFSFDFSTARRHTPAEEETLKLYFSPTARNDEEQSALIALRTDSLRKSQLKQIGRRRRVYDAIRLNFGNALRTTPSDLAISKNGMEFPDCPEKDMIHVNVSQYAITTSREDYQPSDDLLAYYKKPFVPECHVAVYLKYFRTYFRYLDRKALITFLHETKGSILSVGVHHFNQFDHLHAQMPECYRTIDIDPKYEQYGSPFGHRTIDFLDLKDETYDNVVLFGVLGIDSQDVDTGDNYTLFGATDKAYAQADRLCAPNGCILLGPDLHISSDGANNAEFWLEDIKNFFSPLGYLTERKNIYPNNMVYILRKPL